MFGVVFARCLACLSGLTATNQLIHAFTHTYQFVHSLLSFPLVSSPLLSSLSDSQKKMSSFSAGTNSLFNVTQEFPYLPTAWGARGYYPGMGCTPLNPSNFSEDMYSNVGIYPPSKDKMYLFKSYKERVKSQSSHNDNHGADGFQSSYYYNGGLSDRDADSMKLAGLTALACLSKIESGDAEKKSIMFSNALSNALKCNTTLPILTVASAALGVMSSTVSKSFSPVKDSTSIFSSIQNNHLSSLLYCKPNGISPVVGSGGSRAIKLAEWVNIYYDELNKRHKAQRRSVLRLSSGGGTPPSR